MISSVHNEAIGIQKMRYFIPKIKSNEFNCRRHVLRLAQVLFINCIFFAHDISTLSDFNISSSIVTLPKFKIHIENQDEITRQRLFDDIG